MIREEYYGTGNISTHSNWNDATSITATSVTAKKTMLLSIDAQNNGAAAAYLKIYNKASAPAPASDTSLLVAAYMIPSGGGKVNEKNLAVEFADGLGYAISSGAGEADATNVTNVNEVVVNLEYFDKF